MVNALIVSKRDLFFLRYNLLVQMGMHHMIVTLSALNDGNNSKFVRTFI